MSEPHDKLARAYRDLAREEPSSSLDATILAASRRALQRPAASRRWAVPVSIAAVLVLAVGVSVQMQRDEPGVETSAPASGAMPPRAVAPEPAPLPQAQATVTPAAPSPSAPAQDRARTSEKPGIAVPREKKESAAPQASRQDAAPPAMPAPAPPLREEAPPPARPAPASPRAFPEQQYSAPAPSGSSADAAQAPAASNLLKRQAAPSAPAVAKAGALDPVEAELERIATLRSQGRDADADKALEEFRRSHPDYRIPDAMWERVKPR